MFFNIIENLCKSEGISMAKLVADIGLSSSNATYWRNGSIPRIGTLKKIADYFNIPLDSLLAKEIVIEDINNIDEETKKFITEPGSEPYILLSKQAKEKGLSPEVLKTLIDLYPPQNKKG